MKIPSDSSEAFNIAVVGAWNPAIFSPQWVKENIADDQSKDVFMAFAFANAVPMPPRVTVDNINIYPSNQSLSLDCALYSDEHALTCTKKIRKICELLSHTPVSAIGFNFRFHAKIEESDVLTDLFTFADIAKIDAKKYSPGPSSVKRNFQLGNSEFLNLAIEYLPEYVRFEFNFHSDLKSMTEIFDRVAGEKFLEKKAQALEFLNSVYELQLEE
ncbi:hypothetical protein ACCD08_06070 [Telluria sp. Tellsp104]